MSERLIPLVIATATISCGCSHSAITPDASEPVLPETWVRGTEAGTVDLNWLKSFDDPQLRSLVSEAVDNNYQLEQERARLAAAEQTVTIVRADKFPQLDVSLDGTRRGFESSTA